MREGLGSGNRSEGDTVMRGRRKRRNIESIGVRGRGLRSLGVMAMTGVACTGAVHDGAGR